MKGKLIQLLVLGALTAGACFGQSCKKDELFLDGSCWAQVIAGGSAVGQAVWGKPPQVGSINGVPIPTCPSVYIPYPYNNVEVCIPKDGWQITPPVPQVTQAKLSEPVKQPATRLEQTTCKSDEILLDGSCWPRAVKIDKLFAVFGKLPQVGTSPEGFPIWKCPTTYAPYLYNQVEFCIPKDEVRQPAPVAQVQAPAKQVKVKGPKKLEKRYSACTQQFPSLSSDKCWDLAANKFWVGMTVDQLLFSRGHNYTTTNVTVTAGHVSAQYAFYDNVSTVLSALVNGLNCAYATPDCGTESRTPLYYVYVEDGVVTAIQF